VQFDVPEEVDNCEEPPGISVGRFVSRCNVKSFGDGVALPAKGFIQSGPRKQVGMNTVEVRRIRIDL
jgi:hypothetical protein